MKTNFVKRLLVFLILAAMMSSVCCAAEETAPSVKCYNGTFVGMRENGIASFKGIPYAKPPIGELRWKAPEPVEADDGTYDATHFGKSAIQLKASSELASMNPEGQSEDCLTLNIWTADLEKKNKPVMFWIHGGAYSYGGTSDPLYDGQYLVAEHPDILLVSCNYRVGPMGFIDFFEVEGGENFPTSGYNGLLDQIQALKWVQQNIEAFGGDPENVTIFGESAGGGSVTELLIADGTEGLFRRAIAESGAVNFTMTHERFAEIGVAQKLLEKANGECMDDLMALSEAELTEIYLDESDGQAIGAMSVLPLRGEDSILPEDPYQALLDGAGKDVDLIIGTTADEMRYFIDDVCEPALADMEGEEYESLLQTKLELFGQFVTGAKVDRVYSMCTAEEKDNLDRFLELHADEEEIWAKTALMNEYSFRAPAIMTAYNHAMAGGSGKTFMYHFRKQNTNFDWVGACHACELAYVFHNLTDEQFSGTVVPELADAVCGAWTSFAVSGMPAIEGIDWPEYSPDSRETLIFNDDCSISVENDPGSEERQLIETILHYYVAM